MVVALQTPAGFTENGNVKSPFEPKLSSSVMSLPVIPALPSISKSNSFDLAVKSFSMPNISQDVPDIDIASLQLNDLFFAPNMTLNPAQVYSPSLTNPEVTAYALAADMSFQSLWKASGDLCTSQSTRQLIDRSTGLHPEASLQIPVESSPYVDFWSPQSIVGNSFSDQDSSLTGLSAYQPIPAQQVELLDMMSSNNDIMSPEMNQLSTSSFFAHSPTTPVYVSPKDYNTVDCSSFTSLENIHDLNGSSPLIASLSESVPDSYPCFFSDSIFDPTLDSSSIAMNISDSGNAGNKHTDSHVVTALHDDIIPSSTVDQSTFQSPQTQYVSGTIPSINIITSSGQNQNFSSTSSAEAFDSQPENQSSLRLNQVTESILDKRGPDRYRRRKGNLRQTRRSSDLSDTQLDALSQQINKLLKTPKSGDGLYYCPECDRSFVRRYNLKTHFAAAHVTTKLYSCQHCNWEFARKYDLQRHLRKKHDDLQGAEHL